MRVGVIGQGPYAIETAYQLSLLGASVVMFTPRNLEDQVDFYLTVTSGDGKSSYLSFYKQELESKIVAIKEQCDLYQFCDIQRIQKKLLHRNELFGERSRLADLFRIVYTLDPTENVLKQVEENPEVFEKLGSEVIDSLKERVEMSEDVDIVIDARERLFTTLMSGIDGQPVLNEMKWQSFVEYCALDFSQLDTLAGKITVVCNDKNLASYVEKVLLEKWDSFSRVFLLADPMWFADLMSKNEQKWNLDIERFHEKMNHWKALEDYEKAKIPKPAEPSKRVLAFQDLRVMSIDRLLDRNEFFVTAEVFSPENDKLQTFGVDHILSFNSIEGDNIEMTDEPGLFTVRDSFVRDGEYQFGLVTERVDLIKKRLLQYFSKV